MTVDQMHEQFLHWLDKQSNNYAPELTAEEIDIYLNNAYYQFLKTLTENGLEKSQDWMDFTKDITKSYSTASFSTGNKPSGQKVPLPTFFANGYDYRLSLLEEANITYTDCGNTATARVPVIPMTRDEYNKVVNNPFKQPWKEEIIRLTSDYTSTLVGGVITSISQDVTGLVTVNYASLTTFAVGEIISISNVLTPGYNGTFQIAVVGTNQFRYYTTSGLTSPGALSLSITSPSLVTITRTTHYFELIGFTGCTINTYYLDCLKEPIRIQYGTNYSSTSLGYKINQNCELLSKAATKIVEMAVELAMKTLGDPRLQLEQLDKLVKQI
tara:strand:+ start:403 stop:1383 length:981 start_codon:yes stop_codon:yes gene_type:complete